MQKLDKKGISPVITTVFLILIILSSVTIIFYSINKFIKPSLSPQFSCIEAQINLPVTIQSACYNANTQDVEVTLKRSFEEKIPVNSIDFIINGKDSSTTFSCSQSCKNCIILNNGETKKYYFASDENANSISLRISNCLVETKPISVC